MRAGRPAGSPCEAAALPAAAATAPAGRLTALCWEPCWASPQVRSISTCSISSNRCSMALPWAAPLSCPRGPWPPLVAAPRRYCTSRRRTAWQVEAIRPFAQARLAIPRARRPRQDMHQQMWLARGQRQLQRQRRCLPPEWHPTQQQQQHLPGAQLPCRRCRQRPCRINRLPNTARQQPRHRAGREGGLPLLQYPLPAPCSSQQTALRPIPLRLASSRRRAAAGGLSRPLTSSSRQRLCPHWRRHRQRYPCQQRPPRQAAAATIGRRRIAPLQ